MAAITNIAAADEQEERVVLDEDFASDTDQFEEEQEEDEEEDVSLCDLPVNLIKQDQTQFSNPKSEPAHINNETQDEEFDFGSSMRGGSSNFLADTKMCAADEVFFQGQILPLRPSFSSDTLSNVLIRQCPLSAVELRSSSCRSRISHNSSFSSSSSSTTTTGIVSKPRGTRPRNQFYTEPSPKPQIKIPNSRLEKAGSRHHRSSMWDFFRLGLVRTPDMELQDFNKVLRSNSSTSTSNTRANNNAKTSVSRNSSVSSTNSTNFISNYNNDASVINGLKPENSKPKKQSFFSSVHGCKCSIETVASDNVIIKSRSSSGRSSSASHINEGGGGRAAAADSITRAASKEKVAMESKMMMKNNKKQQQQSCKQKEKQALSHHRTYEWLKQLSHANSPSPVHV